jgi:hypothetical protein
MGGGGGANATTWVGIAGSVLRFTLKLVGKGRAVCCEKIPTTSVMHGRLPIIADAREEMLYQ